MSVSINRPRQERPRVTMIDGRSVSRRQSRSRGDARPNHGTRSSFSFPSPNNLQQPTFNTMTTQTTMMKKAIMEATTITTTTIRSSSHQYRYNHSKPAPLLRLNDVLTTPSAVASALDWKKLNGSVLTLNIHSNRISAAVATHPSSMISSTRTKPPPSSSARSLPDIPLGRRATVTDDTRQRLQDYITRITDHPICGVIVAWPIQPDTGRMGAACGRVLHTLDQLLLPINPTTTTSDANANANDDAQDLAATNTTTTPSSSFSSTAHHHDHHQQRRRKQPLWCLWDAGDHTTTPPPPDEWGRSSAFAGPSLSSSSTTIPTIHRASLEQYSTDEALTAMEVWNHFCQAHWPELLAAEVVVAPQSSSYQGHHHQHQHQQQQWIKGSDTTSSTTILKKKKKTLSNNRSGEPRQWAALIHPQQGSIAAHHHS